MSKLGIDIRSFLLADSDISDDVGGERIHQNVAPEEYDGAYIWYARAGTGDAEEESFDDDTGTAEFREYWDLEAITSTLTATLALIELVKNHHRHRGGFGGGTVQAIWVREHADDYIPRGVFSDEGHHVAAVQLEIVGYAAA